MIKLRYDSRDKHYYQHFGQIATTDFPESLDFDTAQYDDIQPIGDVKCTCYTACDIAEDQKNRVFDIDDLWKRIPSSRDGADPRDVFKEVINNGLLPTGQSVRAKDWKSFWSALSGSMDYFDNVRSAIFKSQSPVSGAIFWCSEYSNSTQMVEYKGKLAYILPMGKTYKGGHMFSIEGWITVNGEPMLIIEAWVGKKLLMPRDVFNLAMNKYGACSFVLSTSEMDEKIRLNILEKIKDACINVILLMKQLLVEKKVDNPLPPEPQQVYNEVKEAMKKNLLDEFCLAIRDFEGKPGDLNYRNCNPGNIRGTDGKFLKFKTMDEGMTYLKDYVTRACTGKHKAYSPMFTLIDFFNVYAPAGDNNNPGAYAKWVANRIGVDVSFKIHNLL